MLFSLLVVETLCGLLSDSFRPLDSTAAVDGAPLILAMRRFVDEVERLAVLFQLCSCGKLRESYLGNRIYDHLLLHSDGQMVCQVCKARLPFQLEDGSDYFEREMLIIPNQRRRVAMSHQN